MKGGGSSIHSNTYNTYNLYILISTIVTGIIKMEDEIIKHEQLIVRSNHSQALIDEDKIYHLSADFKFVCSHCQNTVFRYVSIDVKNYVSSSAANMYAVCTKCKLSTSINFGIEMSDRSIDRVKK